MTSAAPIATGTSTSKAMTALQPAVWMRSPLIRAVYAREPDRPTRRPRCMRAVLLATVIGIVAAPPPLAHFSGGGIEFDYPSSWSHRHPGILQHFAASPVIDLSTQPMGDPCTTNGAKTTCTLMPIHRLRPGGVVVAWTMLASLPVRVPHLPKGIRVRITRPGYCRTIGGDESVSATVTVRRRMTYSVGACLRGPGTAASEQAVRAMLASAVPVD
jgi:hypothetical protein